MGPAILVAFVLMLILKLTGIITWSWWIVCVPLYFRLALFIIISIAAGGIGSLFTFGKIFRERASFKRAMKDIKHED